MGLVLIIVSAIIGTFYLIDFINRSADKTVDTVYRLDKVFGGNRFLTEMFIGVVSFGVILFTLIILMNIVIR